MVYAVIGIVAALGAYQRGSDTTGSRGALETILHQPFGQILLGIVTIGLIGHAIWRFVQAIKDTENKGSDAKGIGRHLIYALVGVIYLSLAYFSVNLILGLQKAGNEDSSSQQWTAMLLAQPFGQFLIGGIGLGIIVVALYQIYKAYSRKFLEKLKIGQMSDSAKKWVCGSGKRVCRQEALFF